MIILCVPKSDNSPIAIRIDSFLSAGILAEYKQRGLTLIDAGVYFVSNKIYVADYITSSVMQYGISLAPETTNYILELAERAVITTHEQFTKRALTLIPEYFAAHGRSLKPEDLEHINFVVASMCEEYMKE